MTTQDDDPFALARTLAPEFDEMLGVKDLAGQIEALGGDLSRINRLEQRDFVLGDAISMAGLLVSFISLILQIRRGKTFQNQTQDKIEERLILKLSEQTSLPPETRERLIKMLIKKLL